MKTAIYTWESGALCIQPKSDLIVTGSVQLVLCFGDKECLQTANVFPLLREKFPAATIAICSAAGAIVNTSVMDHTFTVAAVQFGHYHR